MVEMNELVVGFPGFTVPAITAAYDHGLLHLAGPNGSGKTTLMRTLCGELQPISGSVRIGGRDPFVDHRARRHISLAPARSELPTFLTVGEAWRIAAGLRAAPNWDGGGYADQLGISEDLRLSQASTGQRQKAELLCAMAGDPAILLLDETLAHIDADTGNRVSGWLEDWSRTRLVFIAHHGPLDLATDTINFGPGTRV